MLFLRGSLKWSTDRSTVKVSVNTHLQMIINHNILCSLYVLTNRSLCHLYNNTLRWWMSTMGWPLSQVIIKYGHNLVLVHRTHHQVVSESHKLYRYLIGFKSQDWSKSENAKRFALKVSTLCHTIYKDQKFNGLEIIYNNHSSRLQFHWLRVLASSNNRQLFKPAFFKLFYLSYSFLCSL